MGNLLRDNEAPAGAAALPTIKGGFITRCTRDLQFSHFAQGMAEAAVANDPLQSPSETYRQRSQLQGLFQFLSALQRKGVRRTQPCSSQNQSLISVWWCREKQQEENIMATFRQGKQELLACVLGCSLSLLVILCLLSFLQTSALS